MKSALNRLVQCAQHLQAIDKFFVDNVSEYARNEDKLEGLGRYYEEFARQLYAGGRKEGRLDLGGRYHRGLILADLLTYAIFARGYYVATASQEHRRAFVEIVLRVVNKLFLQENISTNPTLRNQLLDTVASLGLENFYEDSEQQKRFAALRKFSGSIIWKEVGDEHYKNMDANLPKSRGLAIEFLIYLYMLQRRFGFVVPLLLHQRLFALNESIAPPDFLVLKSDGRCFGVEVGSQKEGQSTGFMTKTSIPTITAELDNDQPFRCPKCRGWITYCDRVVEDYSKGLASSEPVQCAKCKYFNRGKCSHIVLYGKAPGETGKRRYHLSCVKDSDWAKELEKKKKLHEHLMVWYPTASSIDGIVDKP
jgi:hypothetical protein